jgi:hypothetical protein
MKILHILRSEPDEMTRNLIQQSFEDAQRVEIPMHQKDVDYEKLVEEIFASDKVICWW